MTMTLPKQPGKAADAKKDGPASKAPPGPSHGISKTDLLERGVDINVNTYFLAGWCDGAGRILPDHTSQNAAGLGRAWWRLGLMLDAAVEAQLMLERMVGAAFDPEKTQWTDALTPELRKKLIDRTPEAEEPEPVTSWFAAVAPTLKRWSDLRACTLHLGRVAEYMRLEGQLAAITHERGPADGDTLSEDAENVRHLVVDDPVYRLFRRKTDQP
jgi:hypothetical protein